ncbi:MAG: permease [Acidobacteriota bacterium]
MTEPAAALSPPSHLLVLLIQSSWSVIVDLAPSLLLGAAVAGLLHILLPSRFAASQLRGRAGVLKAVVFGVPLPLCSCGVLPAGLGLKKDGASDGASVGFLISTPQTGVDSIAVSAAFLGWPFALFKVLSAAITGAVGGLLVDRLGPESGESRERAGVGAPAAAGSPAEPQAAGPRRAGRLRAMASHSLEMLESIWGWLVIGVVISAGLEVLVPEQVFAGAAAWGGAWAALAALVLSLPLYVCATASVPIAASLVAAGLPPGAALVFLMAGPATNAATVGAIHRAFGARTLGIYLATLILGSVGFGLGFDFLLGSSSAAAAAHHHHHGAAPWQVLLAALLLGLLAFFAASDARRLWRQRTSAERRAAADRQRLSLPVEGLTCGGCVRKLEKTLSAEPGVLSASVSLDPARATVTGALDEDRFRELVKEAGFRAA